MSEANRQPIQHRYDFVLFFDVTDANPNGDPDAGNLPRIDPETGQGLVTDVCLKRKVRNYVALKHEGQPPYEIYVKERAILNQQHERAWQAFNPKAKDKEKKNLPREQEDALKLTGFMCQNFFDIRAFGAVMTTDVNCGQVRGPVQLGMARSLHPILSQDLSVTRCAVTTEREANNQEGGNRTMGRKFTVPYALYRVHGYINPHLAGGNGSAARGTGFCEDDLELLKEAINRLFEFDASAARPPGSMKPVACVAFKHANKLGNARADELFRRVSCTPRSGVQPLPSQRDDAGNPVQAKPDDRPPRSVDDYQIDLPTPGPLKDLSDVTVEHWLAWG
ncbi:MAG: type I-C CRISPR-associated protein Cas7/Csd2 [Phycisphaeraceae bacterium]